MFFQHFLMCLVVVWRVGASICSFSRSTISGNAQATNFVKICPVYTGTLLITEVSGILSLDGLQAIKGSLSVIASAGISSVTSTTLATISLSPDLISWSGLEFSNCTALRTVNFPLLRDVSGIDLDIMPSLKTFNFSQYSLSGSLYLQSTAFNSISASISASIQTNGKFGLASIISENLDLTNIELHIQSNGTNEEPASCDDCNIYVRDNAPGVKLDLPNFTSLGYLSAEDCSDLQIPVLSVITGDFSLVNLQMTTFSAPKLTTVIGTLNATGGFTKISLPLLSHVGMNIYIHGGRGLDCDSVQASLKNITFGGNFSCEALLPPFTASTSSTTKAPSSTPLPLSSTSESATLASITTKSSSPTSLSRSSTSVTTTSASLTSSVRASNTPPPLAQSSTGGLSSAAKGGIGGGVVAVVLLILLTAWSFWKLGRRRAAGTKSKSTSASPAGTVRPAIVSELPLGGHHEKSEMPASPNTVSELTGDQHYRPRPPIESLPVTKAAPTAISTSSAGAPWTASDSSGTTAQDQNARLLGPGELASPYEDHHTAAR